MDAVGVALLREVLAGTEWLRETRRFAGALRHSAVARGGGLLLVGTDGYEPWHLAAHLDEEAARCGLPELAPTLVRHRVPPGAPAHLSAGLERLSAAGHDGTLLVVTPQDGPPAGDGLLERVDDVRRGGATILALGGTADDPRLRSLAHDVLCVPAAAGPDRPDRPDLDAVQHLISAAAAEDAPRGRRFLDRLSRLAEQLSAPPPHRW
ncbi:hypothetical protein I5Q34_03980 [Streptomyces sp. AV19]|uniref:hypothetical protein n=1 Tax=Streptomyces sp. AV19 TaxID=2793068 RepID=UPI0018FE15D6|nr:hypothetical protein [Streptomyces sp. AV19]MBH1933453.1 hypothetical protein [Streptomyces sp. AV19]MDG4532102.1 hypothetical protein [Streptomyces sp. AV19]